MQLMLPRKELLFHCAAAGNGASVAGSAAAAAGICGSTTGSTAMFQQTRELAAGNRLLKNAGQSVQLSLCSGCDVVEKVKIERASIEERLNFQQLVR